MNAHKKRKTANGAASLPVEEATEHSASSRSPSPDSAAVVPAASSSSTSAVATSRPRPARKQITPQELESIKAAADKSAQTGVTYNIWHNKWAGGDSYDAAANHRKAETRCDIARDSGYTRGDVNGGAYVCLYFARGYCPLGSDCTYLHRLPPPVGLPDQGRDIFGREKHGDYRDDMGGVGSLQRVNRTLYVGRIHEEPRISGPAGRANDPQGNKQAKGSLMKRKGDELSATEKVLWRHFSEWGEIERIRILHHRGCGFVTYVSETSAQFAKEAMMHQSLDHGEILNLRWATEDPNPAAKREHKRDITKQGRERILESLTDEQREVGDAVRRLEVESGIKREDRMLENGKRGPDDGREEDEGDDEQRRARIEQEEAEEEEFRRLEEENARGWAEYEAEQAPEEKGAEQQEQNENYAAALQVIPEAKGLLSSDVLSGLQSLKAIQTAKKPAAGLGGLAAYGSDSEED